MNKIILSGRLTKDSELRTTQNNKEVLTGSIAVNRNFKNKDGEYDTDFFDFTIWSPTDYIKKNTKKGTRALISGSIHREEYEKDKQKRYTYKIMVENIELLLSKEEVKVPENYKTEYENTVELQDSDLPF